MLFGSEVEISMSHIQKMFVGVRTRCCSAVRWRSRCHMFRRWLPKLDGVRPTFLLFSEIINKCNNLHRGRLEIINNLTSYNACP